MKKIVLMLLMFGLVTPLWGTWTYITEPEVKKGGEAFDLNEDQLNIDDRDSAGETIYISYDILLNSYTSLKEVEYYFVSTDESNLIESRSTSALEQEYTFEITGDGKSVLDDTTTTESSRKIIIKLYFEDSLGTEYPQEETIEIKYDLLRPEAPLLDKIEITGGDGNLNVDWDHYSSDESDNSEHDKYRIYYIPFQKKDGTPVEGKENYDEVSGTATSAKVTGLTNDVVYRIEVVAIDDAGNESARVEDQTTLPIGMPEPVDDFYEHYSKYGGEEEGCNFGGTTGSGLFFILLLIAGLIYSRRKEGEKDVA